MADLGFFFSFWWDWDLNSGLHTCKAGRMDTSIHLAPVILEMGSRELFAQAGLEP
jgi:hypothetical protein